MKKENIKNTALVDFYSINQSKLYVLVCWEFGLGSSKEHFLFIWGSVTSMQPTVSQLSTYIWKVAFLSDYATGMF